jgi:hypothetical protein
MKITTIEVTQKTTTGDYEHLIVHVSAALEEDDGMNEAASKVTNFVDWFARKPVRDAQARNKRSVLADENASAEDKAAAEKWLAVYDRRKAEIEAM